MLLCEERFYKTAFAKLKREAPPIPALQLKREERFVDSAVVETSDVNFGELLLTVVSFYWLDKDEQLSSGLFKGT